MPELSIFEIVKNSLMTLTNSKVFILIMLEMAILIVSLIFSRLMDKKVVKITAIASSVIILGFYITNYVRTLGIFIDNVSTKIMEIIYFPTTLEFIIVMIISLIIMGITWASKKSGIILKIVNSVMPLGISFTFLGIIEYINKNNVAFDEFSTFTNPMLMSLYEFAMALFVTWMIGLFLYKVNGIVIKRATLPTLEEEPSLVTVNLDALNEDNNLVMVDLSALEDEEEEIELPRLKGTI